MGYFFGLGKQVIRHNQLLPGASKWGIICINYCWLNSGIVETVAWEPGKTLKDIIQEFDEVIREADWVIGKNSDRFDNKMINSMRMFSGLAGMPEWTKYTDDLERQMRRYFKLPSQSLDYISGQFGLGGKDKMDFNDWIDIQNYMLVSEMNLDEIKKVTRHFVWQLIADDVCDILFKSKYSTINTSGAKALNKMIQYGRKDVKDTEELWLRLSEHFEPKFNMATFKQVHTGCKHCGSTNLGNRSGIKIRISNKTRYREMRCRDCGCYAGRQTISGVKERLGRIG